MQEENNLEMTVKGSKYAISCCNLQQQLNLNTQEMENNSKGNLDSVRFSGRRRRRSNLMYGQDLIAIPGNVLIAIGSAPRINSTFEWHFN